MVNNFRKTIKLNFITWPWVKLNQDHNFIWDILIAMTLTLSGPKLGTIRSLFILFVIAISKRTLTTKKETSRTSSGGLAVKKCQFSASPLKIPKVLYNWFFRLLLSSFNCYFDMTPGWANCRSLSEMCVRNSRHNEAQSFMQSYLF